ncbi:MAG: sugar phosphate isomerase/epimerase family protein [Thermoguttaceae bacterium]
MTRLLSRRSMLRHLTETAAFTAAVSTLAPLLAAPETRGSRARGFKIGACDWSLGKRGDPAALDLAKEIGLDGVQIDMGNVGNDMRLRTPEFQKQHREAAARTGLALASLAICELNNVPLRSDPRAAEWVAQSVDVCKALGLPVVLIPCFGKGDLDMSRTAEIDHVVKVLKEVAPKAEKQGVALGLEDYLSAEDNRKIIDRVGSPAVKVYYDVGNSTDKGRDVVKEIRALGKLICEFHAKDGNYMLGQGRIDFKQVRQAMDDIEYSGWIQIEAAHPHGLVPDYTADRKYLKDLFPARV